MKTMWHGGRGNTIKVYVLLVIVWKMAFLFTATTGNTCSHPCADVNCRRVLSGYTNTTRKM